MRFAALALLLCFAVPVFAEDSEADPAKLPTKPAEAPDEVSGSVIILSWKGAPKAIPKVTRTKEEAKAHAEEALKAWAKQHGGRLKARVVVLPNGRVSPGQIQVVESTNPEIREALIGSIASCRFAPGRSGGVPVAAFAIAGTAVQMETR